MSINWPVVLVLFFISFYFIDTRYAMEKEWKKRVTYVHR